MFQLRRRPQKKGHSPWEQPLEQKGQVDLHIGQQARGALGRGLQIQSDGESVIISQWAIQLWALAYTRVYYKIALMEGKNTVRTFIFQAALPAMGDPDASVRICVTETKRWRISLYRLNPNTRKHRVLFNGNIAASRFHETSVWRIGVCESPAYTRALPFRLVHSFPPQHG